MQCNTIIRNMWFVQNAVRTERLPSSNSMVGVCGVLKCGESRTSVISSGDSVLGFSSEESAASIAVGVVLS
jgi:hypothetical protein